MALPTLHLGLNEIIKKNHWLLPLISSAFELLQGATIYTKLDLCNSYHLVHIQEAEGWKTAFNTPSGHSEYLVMLYGLTNELAVFHNLVNNLLKDIINKFIYLYLDSILIFSQSLPEHVHYVWAVLLWFLQNHLYVKAEKYEFHSPTILFVGFILSAGNIKMGPEKMGTVRDWPTMDNCMEIQRFHGFVNF